MVGGRRPRLGHQVNNKHSGWSEAPHSREAEEGGGRGIGTRALGK